MRRTRLIVGGIVAAIIFSAIIVDFSVTTARVPDLPPPCAVADDEACNETRNAAVDARIDEAIALEDDLRSREWLYAGVLTAIALGLSVIGIARSTRDGRRQAFADLGIAGVIWLLACVALLMFTGDDTIDIAAKPLFAPFWSMCVAGAIGSLALHMTRSSSDGSPRGEERKLTVPYAEPAIAPASKPTAVALPVVGGLVTTALSIALAVGSNAGRNACGVADPGWTDPMLGTAFVLAALAALAGLVCLAKRRWIVALICITFGPIVCVVALLVASCLS